MQRKRMADGQVLAKAKKMLLLVFLLVRTNKLTTALLGPFYKANAARIEIILTFECDLLCVDCSIMCRQAPSQARMTCEQIEKFVRESIDQNRRWECIRIIGGEPTLHPDMMKILALLSAYKENYSPDTAVQLCTNGFNPRARDMLAGLPAGIEVEDSAKTFPNQTKHIAVNYAPVDQKFYRYSDFTNGCRLCVSQGWGLSPYGYYHCNIAAAIDRVIGLDIGRKKMPPAGDSMALLSAQLCRYCGFFRKYQKDHFKPGYVSPTWEALLANYQRSTPELTRYGS